MSKKLKFSVEEGSADGSDAPMVVTFPLGVPQNLHNGAGGINFRSLKNETKKGTQRLVHGYSETVHYIGKNYGDQSVKKNLYNYAIGMSTGGSKMTVVPVEHVYRLDQHVVDQEKDVFQVANKEETFDEKMTRRNLLVEEFGSKKRKRVVRSKVANRVNMDAKEEMEAAAANIGVQLDIISEKAAADKSGTASDVHAAAFLPPFDKETKNVEDIYKLDDIILESEYKDLNYKDLIKISKKPSELASLATSNEYPSFVVQRLGALHDLPKSAQRKSAAALVYLTYLIRYHSIQGNNKAAKMEQLQCEQHISDRILSTFGELRGDK